MINSISQLNGISNQINITNKKDTPNLKPEPTEMVKTNANVFLGKDLVQSDIDVSKLNVIIDKIKDKDGQDFANAAYTELVKLMNLEDSAPNNITWEKNEGRPIVGDYRFYNNSVVFYTDYFLKMDKATQIGIIAHELTHCKQLTNMLRTEGLPVEKIAYAYAVSDAKAMLMRNPQVIKMYNTAKSNGKEKEFLQQLVKAGTIKTAKELFQAHAKTLALPKHPLNSPQGQKAQKDWIAQYNYNGADEKAYNDCLLEKEAMSVEKRVTEAFKNRNK